MLRQTGVEVIKSIDGYYPRVSTKTITVDILVGSLVDDAFVSDGRGLIHRTIKNIPDRQTRKTESLTVNAAGQITLSIMPIEENPIELDGVAQDHVSGQVVDCTGYNENDTLKVSYYYMEAGRDWFNEAGAFIQADDPDMVGLSDYKYNSTRIWSILVAMGLESGEIF